MEYNSKLTQNSRITVIQDYQIISLSNDKDYDDLIFLASSICNVPVAYLGIVAKEKILFKSRTGISVEEMDLENSFTQATLESCTEYFSANFSEDPELFQMAIPFFDKDYKFYCGVPIINAKGLTIGTLNILDVRERELQDFQKKSLKVLANQIMKLLEFRNQNYKFLQIQNKLKQKYHELEKFASLVSHDIKSPLANIISLTELLREENKDKLNEETLQYLDYLVESSYSLRNYVDGILNFYRSENILEKAAENVDLHQILKEIAHLYDVSNDVEIKYPETASLKNINKAALTQILLNLISNALKYNNRELRKINISFHETPDFYHFEVIDNGVGFSAENSDKIFELFHTLDTNDRDGNPGSGIGLATVKKLVNSLGGEISVNSTPGLGSKFSFSIRRH
ncbi:sensor histidine kinase [Gillisia sp. Q332]|uniref:sensor histidine kinase n=1 Tax=Gillisia xinjiangensis TaxID=3384765 RepID=UPI00391DED17